MPQIARTYPHGVPCWIDLAQPDLDAATAFYGGLFGWEFHDAMPPDAPGSYLIATLGGEDAAALTTGPGDDGWLSYIACDDADATADAVSAADGRVIDPPEDAGPGGRAATCADPQGAVFRLWQARRRLGAQIVDVPNAWAFSDLRTPDAAAAVRFYAEVFGWRHDSAVAAGMIRLDGYGDHLESTVDPDIRRRQAGAPEGFADVVAALEEHPGEAEWTIRFTTDDRDDQAARVTRLGGVVLNMSESEWTRDALVADPQGARFSLSQIVIPDGF